MKTLTSKVTLFAVIAALGLSTQQSNATLVANDGDLLLGFRATGGTGATTNYVVNVGKMSDFRDATTVLTLSLGNIDADLDNLFGSNWANRSDFLWSVSGVQFSTGNGYTQKSLFASRAQAFPLAAAGLSGSSPWSRETTSTQGGPASLMNAYRTQFKLGTTGASGSDQIQSTNSTVALIQPHGQNNSHEEFMSNSGFIGGQTTSGASFAYFPGGIEGSFVNGAAGSALDLYAMAPLVGGGNGLYEGTFAISDSGSVTFTPAGVPEPTSALLVAAGCTALITMRRRREQTA